MRTTRLQIEMLICVGSLIPKRLLLGQQGVPDLCFNLLCCNLVKTIDPPWFYLSMIKYFQALWKHSLDDAAISNFCSVYKVSRHVTSNLVLTLK
ncbi:hypothetical protein OPV22_018373 [Ensete ventricosum]|uniref:Uncharacterized protein n=1 Tax=Ensete ventricosum TaxID=4639 RepID=A0AAV8QYI3_ENSVE|nr:hypothetical protein OPV22_018373 [Ensete ventricosum]